MSGLFIGYARVSTEEQDLTAQRNGLSELGVDLERIYVDHGLTGTNRDRPGLREALAACRAGDTQVVTKLDRLARSLPDARAIAEDLTKRKVRLSLGGSVYDPTDPVGRLLFNVLAMVAEFEADLIRSRTREGMRVAKAKGHLRGKQPKLNPRQEAHLVELLGSGEYTTAEVGDLFRVARSTVYRAVERSKRPKSNARAGVSGASASGAAPAKTTASVTGRSVLIERRVAEPPASTYRPRHGSGGGRRTSRRLRSGPARSRSPLRHSELPALHARSGANRCWPRARWGVRPRDIRTVRSDSRGIVLALFPLAKLARDGNTEPEPSAGGIRFTIGVQVDSAEEVDRLTAHMRAAGAHVTKEPVDAELFTGRSAYLCDPEGNYFEIVWADIPTNPVVIAARRAAGL